VNPSTKLDAATIRTLAGSPSFERGTEYALRGRVVDVLATDAGVTATVRGSDDYAVRLWADGGAAAYSCSCPVGLGGAFCKHCVAVALVAFDAVKPEPLTLPDPLPERAVLEGHLLRQSPRTLTDLLLGQAESDDVLKRRLLLAASRENGSPLDVARYRREVGAAFTARGFVDYRRMPDFARRAHAMIDELHELLRTGYATDSVGLIEHALARLDTAAGHVDDSDGYLSDIRSRLTALHVEACERGSPDRKRLARTLYRFALTSELEIFIDAGATHRDALGPAGLKEYRRLAERDWAQIEPRLPGAPFELDLKRFRVTYVMERLAESDGDVDALVAVRSRDLSSEYRFLVVAETLWAVGRREEALEWAERGLRAFPERTDRRLRQFAASAYQAFGRHDEAMSLAWAELVDDPSLASYQVLNRHARAAGTWPEWRERALAHVRSISRPVSTDARGRVHRWFEPEGHSTLVSVFLWEGDDDAAWAEASAGGCRHELWLRLARTREAEHPEDAIEIYRRDVERSIETKDNRGYAEAVETMKRIRVLMEGAGRIDDFHVYAVSVRVAHAPKRNLIKLLDANGW
jgi:uncharacterized Zn finger protein